MRWMKVWGGVRAATPMVGATLALLTLSGCPAAEGGGEDQGLGQLGESCSASGECLDGFECVGQICTNACVDDFGCALGFRCDGGFCAQDSNGNGQIGDVCERDGDCGGELRCFEDPQDGRFCVQTCDLGGNDCPPGQPCVPVTGDLGYCDFDANPNNDPNNQPNNEPNNDPNNDPNNNPNNDPNNDPNNNPGCDPPCAGDETCINGVCVPDEEESCEQAGQSCTAETVDGNGLTCVVADNTDEARTCRATCTQDEQCGQGEFCGEPVGAGVRVCLPGNCTSILSSAEECTGVGANGGTCVLRRPGVFYCLAAGTGALEAQCGSEADCGAGLGCVQGGFAQPCPEGDDGACGQAAACVAANVASEPGVGICQAQDPGCENVDQVCQGAEDDRAELICAVGNPLAPQLQTCLSACEPGAQDCPQGQLCASLQRDGQSVTACVASNCNSALAPDQCAGIGPDGGNCLPAGNGALRCVSAGQGQDGAACADERQCAAGLGCDGSFCRPLCQLGAPDACAPGSVCQETLGDDVFGTCTPGECDPVCGVGQTCFRGECVDDGACQAIGQPCDDQTADGDGLLCVLGDSLDEEAATCHRVCDVDFDDCPSGSVCVDLDDDTGVCLRSNCDSPVESQAQCGAIDGTCLPLGNQTYFCAAAGDAAEGQACEATADCAAGLGCLQGECSPMCSVEPDTCGQERCVTIFNDEDFGVCGDGCPGFQQEGACGPDQGCLPLSNDNGLCVDVGPRQAGEPCNPDAPGQECGEFLSCVNLGEQGQVCQPWCNLTLENPEIGCADNELCLDAFDGLDAVGLCFPECTPFAPVGQNGCEIDGFQSCIPQNGPDEGVCQASGDTPAGENCLNNGSILGDCQAGLACLTEGEQLVGVCEPLCRTFSSVGNFESGCGAGQVCEIFGQDFGVCSDNVLPGNLQAGDSCPTAGQWCSDDTLCLGVGVDENLCLTLCRSREGDADCPQGQACELGIFDGDVFGLCL